MQDARRLVALGIVFEGGLALLALAIGWFMHPPVHSYVAWRAEDVGWGILGTLPMLLALWVTRTFALGPLAELKKLMDEVLIPLFRECTIGELAIISLLAGVGEELLFRGLIQTALTGWLGPLAALIATSVLFGLAHAISTTYALLATLIGLYLGWLWLATGNLLAPILAHALYDFLALLLLTRLAVATPEGPQQGSPGQHPGDAVQEVEAKP